MGAGYEFVGMRSQLYTQSLAEYPDARIEDIQAMNRYLNPQPGEYILGFGEGNGYFCHAIAEAVGIEGYYLITDPSQEQLDSLLQKALPAQVTVRRMGVENLKVPPNFYDKVWSCGAFHHCPNQTEALKRIYQTLKPGGRLVLFDGFQGTSLVKYFDMHVAKYCVTGHEAKFMSEEFARTLCYLAGFQDEKVEIIDVKTKWHFKTEKDIALFLYNFHAMTNLPGTEEERIQKIIEDCKKSIGIESNQRMYQLNWPMRAILATK